MLSDGPKLSLGGGIYAIDTYLEKPIGMKLVNIIICMLNFFQIHRDKSVVLM